MCLFRLPLGQERIGGAETAGPFGGNMFDPLSSQRRKRRLLRIPSRPKEQRNHAFRLMILSIPAGKVSTYGKIAAAAGYPRNHRAVARLLRTNLPDPLPWHRV